MLRHTHTDLFASATAVLLIHGKNTARRPIRTAHSTAWWKKSKANLLTAKTIEEAPAKPGFAHFTEEVDRPHVIPSEATCFQCSKAVDADGADTMDYLWVPSGNAAAPTSAGYFFHAKCFKCAKCKFRFHHNKFYSLDNRAVCIECALGRPPAYPYRWWHGNRDCITLGRTSSRMAGRNFPRHNHQMEFLFDPNS